jgi:single-stranded DNA-binding protein
MATNNNFAVTGIVAMDAQVKNNGNGSVWAKFPLSIRITRKDKDNNEKKNSALQDIEVGTKEGSPKLDLLKKGTLVKVEGFFEPRVYTGKDEKEHFVLSWKATAIEKIEKKEKTTEA